MSTLERAKRLLLVDDDFDLREIMVIELTVAGFDVVSAASGHAAQAILASSSFDVVVSDIRMPDGDGVELLRWVRTRDTDIPVFLVTGYAKTDERELAALGCSGLFHKPFDLAVLVQAINQKFAKGVA